MCTVCASEFRAGSADNFARLTLPFTTYKATASPTCSPSYHRALPYLSPQLESVHINRSEPSLWLAFEYAEYDLYEMIKFHRDHRENRRDNPYGA